MDKIDEILTRGVENIVPSKSELEKVLRSGKKLNIYNGVDPTGAKIHIGHTIPLRKLQALIELGHHVTFLIGDFTAFIGDTSDKNSERPQLTEEEIMANWQTYKRQASKVLDFSKIPVVRNTEWLNGLGFIEVIKLARHFSLNEFIARELIKKRLTEGGSINLAEVLYPLAQGYDSWHLKTDLQIGGTEQIFNMQAGRTLIKDFDGRESFTLTNSTLEGTDGRKMSKSWGNAIWIEDEPDEMFGKIMSLRDDLIIQYFTLAIKVPLDKIADYKKRLDSGENPMVLKKELGNIIVGELHTPEAAIKAQNEFEIKHQQGDWQSANISLPTLQYKVDMDVSGALIESSYAKSVSEAKRLIRQGAIDVNSQTINQDIQLSPGDILRVGKNKGVKIIQKL